MGTVRPVSESQEHSTVLPMGTNIKIKNQRKINILICRYNFVVRIPAGASSIDIRQKGFLGKKKDDNYIAVRDVDTGEYLINGGFILSMFKKSIQYGDVILDYTGSDTVTERLNSTKPLRKDLVVEVLTVGALNPPDVSYTYLVSRERQVRYRWRTGDRWSHCDKLCGGG